MQIEVWSDMICPWCYIGKRRLEQALAQFGPSESVNVIWRSFELDTRAPAQYPCTLNELLARKYAISLQQAEAMSAHVTELAREAGLIYRLDHASPGNSFDAHRLLHFAAARQQADLALECIMHGYFCDSLPVGDRAALARLAPKFGIAENEAMAMLESDAYADAVRADEGRAAQIGIAGVPFFMFNGKSVLSGAQPLEVFVEMLQQFGGRTVP